MKIILKALAMVRPSSNSVSAPSELRGQVEISEEAFSAFADTAKTSLVSLEEDGVSNPQQITSYSLPTAIQTGDSNVQVWPGRYIVTGKKDD